MKDFPNGLSCIEAPQSQRSEFAIPVGDLVSTGVRQIDEGTCRMYRWPTEITDANVLTGENVEMLPGFMLGASNSQAVFA